MKFKLDEKFILSERFILTEADNFNKQEVEAAFNKLQAQLNSLNTKQYNDLANTFNVILKNIDTILAIPANINGKTSTFKEAAPNIANNLTAIKTEINSILGQLNKNIEVLSPDKLNYKLKLIEKLKNLTAEQSINSVSELNALTTTLSDINQAISKISIPNLKLLTTTDMQQAAKKEDSNSLIKKIKNDISYLGTFLKTNSVELEQIAKLITDFDTNIDKFKNLKNNTSKNTKSWDEQYKEVFLQKNDAEALENFWNTYYATEWKDDTSGAIKNLGYTFKQELVRLGFSEKVNPFVSFLKHNLQTIVPHLTANNYAAIHNAYIKEYLNANILRQKDSNAKLSLIYNPNLYKKTPAEILEYLQLQHELFLREKRTEINNYLVKDDIIYQAYQVPANFDQLMAVLFMDTDAEIELGDHVKNPQTVMQTENLRPISKIKELWITCFGEEATTPQANWSQSTGQYIIRALKDNTYQIIQAMKYLIAVNNGNFEWLKRYEETAKADLNFDVSLTKNFAKKFSLYDINEQNIEEVITDIAKAANFKRIGS